MMECGVLETESGPIYVEVDEDGAVTRCGFSGDAPTSALGPNVSRVLEQLREYFSGRRKNFDVEIRLEGTDFQRSVWEALRAIPFGETISYAELARRVGSPKAVRAVGRANGANPVAVIVPCHRVVGSDGSLTGYGGGMVRKCHLLRLEGVELNESSTLQTTLY